MPPTPATTIPSPSRSATPDETGEFSPVTYDRVVELTAWLCETFRLDPETDVIRHYDVTEKRCPLYYVEHPEGVGRLPDGHGRCHGSGKFLKKCKKSGNR